MNSTGREPHCLRVAAMMPCLNEEASVDATFQSLLTGTRIPDEILVADGGSTDRTLALVEAWRAKGYPIRILSNDKVFPGAGRNAAASASSADILVSIDFGNTFDPDYVEKMVAPFEADAGVDVVAGTFVPRTNSPLERVIGIIDYHNNTMLLRLTPEERIRKAPPDDRHVPGMSVAWRRSLWEKVGGQPDWLRAAEDLLFGVRVLTFAPRFGLQVEAQVYHHMRSSIGAFFRMRQTYARGRARAGLVTAAMLKRHVIFLGACLLLASSAVNAWLAVPGGLALALWVWRNVIKVFLLVDHRLPSPADFVRGLAVAAARELGALSGLVLGGKDWLSSAHWRDKRRAFMNGDMAGDAGT